MNWQQAVLHAIDRQLESSGSNQFTRETLVQAQLPMIVRLTQSRGRTPDQTVSRVLQELRDAGALSFVAQGLYETDRERISAHLNLEHPFNNLDIGEHYTRSELAPLAMEYGYGKLTAGITPRGTFPATDSVVVFADVPGRYGNFWDDESGDLWYVGEDDSRTHGKDAYRFDQVHDKGKNRVLTHHRQLGHPIFLFTRQPKSAAFRYEGLVDVVEFDYFREDSRRVVRYRLRPLGVSSAVRDYQLQALAERSVIGQLAHEPSLKEDAEVVEATTLQRYRSRTFSVDVRTNYAFTCAVCGEERYNYKDHAEVDAAHLYPVARNGSNDVRNGVALCKFHHWAFDGHLYFIDTDLRVTPTLCGTEVRGIQEFAGERLVQLPTESRKQPHKLFLEARRRLVPAFLVEPQK